jgi:hypothetical protein
MVVCIIIFFICNDFQTDFAAWAPHYNIFGDKSSRLAAVTIMEPERYNICLDIRTSQYFHEATV